MANSVKKMFAIECCKDMVKVK